MPRLTLFVAGALAVVVLSAALPDARGAAAPTTRTIYFSAVDGKGAVVADLAPSDLTIKEGGKEYAAKSLAPAKTPMTLALLVDDGGGGGFQQGVAQFLQKVFGKGKIAISVFKPKPSRIVDFTSEFDALKGGLMELGARARVKPDGDQLLDAIQDAASTLQQMKAERPIIVALTVAGGSPQVVDSDYVLKKLRESGASLHLVAAAGADVGQVLNDGPKYSGGRAEMAGSPAIMTAALAAIGDTIAGQYQLTYELPDGVKMSDRLELKTSRAGVTLFAPQRIPDK